MKTCDICKRHSGDEPIFSVTIGTSVAVRSVGDTGHEFPVECELCVECIRKVTEGLDKYLSDAFGLVIRK